ncbi:MAG: hypothetical protein ACFB50_08255 [Rubrobacteraceae bacterium]
MSVWAQSWAYEQRLGKWREVKGKKAWKGDPGAKSVLAAVATFADEAGYAYCGQDTLAAMTDMTERSVREHLHNLEHAYKRIRREHRRKGSGRGKGEFTSDGIWLLAPTHRLRPPKSGDQSPEVEPPEKFAVGEKRAYRRRSLPPGGRKSFPGNRQGVEPSGEPSVAPAGARDAALDHRADTYVAMIERQTGLLGVSLDADERRNLGVFVKALIEDREAMAEQMLRFVSRYSLRRGQGAKIRFSQAWSDVAAGPKAPDSGTTADGEAAYEEEGYR